MLIGGRIHRVEEIDWVGEARLDFAETNLPDYRNPFQVIPALLRLKEKFNLFLLVHGPEEGNPLDCHELQSTLLPQIKTLVEFASELDARLITIHFWLDRRFITKAVAESKLSILEAMLNMAEKKDIKLCLENLSERPGDFEQALRLFPEMGLTLDIGHGELLTQKNRAYSFLETYPERISHTHIHDNRGGNTPGDDLHLPLGEGLIAFNPILTALCQTGYDKTITLEVAPTLLTQEKEKMITLLDEACGRH